MGSIVSKTPVEETKKKSLPPEVHEARTCKGCGSPMFLKPVIQCRECGATVPLRCFSYKQGSGFYAECIDLNLLSRGNTREEAVVRLQEQMFSYVATVFEGSPEGLIPRRAPISSFIRYYLTVIRDRLLRHRHPHHSSGQLQIPGAKTFSHC
jgi:hypothetical protein